MTKRRSLTDRFSVYLSEQLDSPRLQYRVQSGFNLFSSWLTKACAVVVSVCVVWAVAPHVETQLFGVAHSWRATNIHQIANGNWQMDVYATKSWYRANCEYLPGQTINALVMAPDSVPYEGRITFLDDDSPDSTRPATGVEQFFGRWELSSKPSAPVGSQVLGRVKHDCDMPWITITNVGPFLLEESP